ncbi:unnamed protein product [Leptidea sinapis]|uniref:Uncharacterized protein n=1 Tax=Leptidea sinapis TaxID=189913 RepID=A0A5E4R6A9_9NEOP|nr:unnamed protein product [Leptidea sinapis]
MSKAMRGRQCTRRPGRNRSLSESQIRVALAEVTFCSYDRRLSATMELESVMERPSDPAEQAVWDVRWRVCGDASRAAGGGAALPSPAAGLLAPLPAAVTAQLAIEIRRDISTENINTRSSIQELTDSVKFMSDKLDKLQSDLAITTEVIKKHETEISALRSEQNHIIPSESAVLDLVSSHCELMSTNTKYSISTSLMMLAFSASKILEIASGQISDSLELTRKTMAITDGRLKFLSEPLGATLTTIVPQAVKAEEVIHEHILRTTYHIKYWKKILDRQAGRAAYEVVFIEDTDFMLAKILLAAPHARNAYTDKVIKREDALVIT